MSSKSFFAAVKAGQIDEVRKRLGEEPALASARSDGATPLHLAAIAGHREIAEALLFAGADPNVKDDELDMTPIAWANEEGRTEMVQFLANRGAAMYLPEACGFGLIDKVRSMLD